MTTFNTLEAWYEMAQSVHLTLPLPPSPNAWPSHPMQLHRRKNEYRAKCWRAAFQQAKPFHRDDVPERVEIRITYQWPNREHFRDEDNASGGVKWTLDALKALQRGQLRWRGGLYDDGGYFLDDDPAHLTLTVEQEEATELRGRPAFAARLRVEITPIA